MTRRQRVADFIRSFGPEPPGGVLDEIRQEACRDRIPIIRPATEDLLRVLLHIVCPERILEVGTAIGFSSVYMAGQTMPRVRIDTIEKDPVRKDRALFYIKKAGLDGRIRLLFGDAARILPELSGPYDFVFMDAAKGQYIRFLPEILRLLGTGGVLVSDNVLQDGAVLESRYAIRRRDHTIHSRMREYLYALTHDDRLDTVILETGDGMTVSVKKDEATMP